MAIRLERVMDQLVDKSQFAFIKDRYVMDNVVTVEKLIFSLQKQGISSNIIKIDFAKAFDIVDWEFLMELLTTRALGNAGRVG